MSIEKLQYLSRYLRIMALNLKKNEVTKSRQKASWRKYSILTATVNKLSENKV